MSRSYKKTGAFAICSSNSDKEDRTLYHRAFRRKIKNLLHEVSLSDIERDLSDSVGLSDSEFSKVCITCKVSNVVNEDFDYSDEYCVKSNDPYIPWHKCVNHKCLEICPETAIDKIVTKGIDYSLPMADKWSWGSDGGTHWQEDFLSIRKDFDAEVFGVTNNRYQIHTIWDDYLYCRDRYSNTNHSSWSINLAYKVWKKGTKPIWSATGHLCGIDYNADIYEWSYKHIRIPYKKHLKVSDIPETDWDHIDSIRHISNIESKYYLCFGWYIEFLFKCGVIPQNFTNPEDLISWLRKNEERIIRLYFKRQFGK
jgi:hypothetical protein